MSDLIQYELKSRVVTITDEAKASIAKALETSALVCKVQDAPSNDKANAAQAEVKTVLREIEKARVEAKAPLLVLGKAIDQAKKDAVAELEAEELRLGRLIGDFAALEEAKARDARLAAQREIEAAEAKRKAEEARLAAEEQARLAEIRKKENEALEAARKIKNAEQREAEAERIRKEAEALKSASEAKSHEEREKVQYQAEMSNFKASQAILDAQPVKAKGQMVRADWDVTVLDILSLSRAFPQCVNMTPRLSEIKSLLNSGIQLPGVKADPVMRSSNRTATGQMIDV